MSAYRTPSTAAWCDPAAGTRTPRHPVKVREGGRSARHKGMGRFSRPKRRGRATRQNTTEPGLQSSHRLHRALKTSQVQAFLRDRQYQAQSPLATSVQSRSPAVLSLPQPVRASRSERRGLAWVGAARVPVVPVSCRPRSERATWRSWGEPAPERHRPGRRPPLQTADHRTPAASWTAGGWTRAGGGSGQVRSGQDSTHQLLQTNADRQSQTTVICNKTTGNPVRY